MFRSQTPERVRQEWYGLLLAYNAVRKTMSSAAEDARVPAVRLSFTGAVERLRECLEGMMMAPRRDMAARRARMLNQIGRAILSQRPGRLNPRVVKIKTSNYPVKHRMRAA